MSDQDLKKTVLDELEWEPSIDAAHIGVTARDGVVTLTGHIGSYAQKWAAERAASSVYGVRGLAEELEVRYPYSADQGDEDIAKRALLALAWNVSIPKNKVKVKIESGWATLTGDLEWFYQKHDAEADVRKLAGVIGVTNDITIKPSIQAADVHHQIRAALERNAQIGSDDIVVRTTGGTVTLSGRVDTYHEKTLAENTAWSAPGVTQVVDLLTIG